MKLSVNTSLLMGKYTEEEAIALIKEVGFDAYDSSLCESMRTEGTPFYGSDRKERAREIRKYADKLGISCNQAHAPFASSCGDETRDEEIFREITEAIETASILGAKIIVVHPKQHLTYAEHSGELFELNMEFYKRLIPYCEKFGIKVAVENMWQRNPASKAITHSVCSRASEFNKYIDCLESDMITGCLDIGHISLVSDDIPKFIHDMGSKRIKALHVHDTDFINDLHAFPLFGKIDYASVAKALGEIGYTGDLTFETTSHFLEHFPKELYPSGLKMLHDIGRYLISEIEKSRG